MKGFENKNIYFIKTEKFFSLKIFFVIILLMLLFFGMYKVFDFEIFIAVNFITPLAILSTYNSYICFNFESRKYRESTKVFFLTFGKWKDIPEFDYISLYRAKMSRVAKSTINDDNLWEHKYKLQFVKNKNKIQIALFNKKEEAIQTAKILSAKLNLKTYDSTQKNWIF